MNRTKIEWTNFSWNVVTGCKHGCWYCYARKLCLRFKKIFPNGFEPTFHPERLTEPWDYKKPSKIFVCSIADLFASWTPKQWRDEVLKSMYLCPVPHTFQMLTKNPESIPTLTCRPLANPKFDLVFDSKAPYPDNWWFGTTVTGEGIGTDVCNIKMIKQVPAKVRFVSFEPLLNNIDFRLYSLEGIQWVIIGKLTGSKRVKLQPEWVQNIIDEADRWNIPIFMKNNLLDYYTTLRQEFPR